MLSGPQTSPFLWLRATLRSAASLRKIVSSRLLIGGPALAGRKPSVCLSVRRASSDFKGQEAKKRDVTSCLLMALALQFAAIVWGRGSCICPFKACSPQPDAPACSHSQLPPSGISR